MKNNSIKYRIPVCIFLFVSGTIISILFSNALNDMIVYGRLTTQLTDPGALIGNIFTQDKLGQLFLLLEALVVLICIVYFVCAKRTDNLSIPVPYGQGQHGTTWFMSEKEKKEVFDYIKISPMNPLVSKLVALGKERYEAIENGEELVAELAKNGINATVIGKFTNDGLYIVNKGEKQALDEPDVDELYRV